ncbi:MAG: type II/IV secretion system protein [Candidatus Colwellbacteria bacterium]|nr:type II/IV secretion system protein [Candidatus Colwellbacteria bacterium]
MLQIPPQKLKEILTQDQLIAPEVFDEVASEAARLGQGLADTLISRHIITEDYYINALSFYLSVPLSRIEGGEIDANVLKLLPENIARDKRTIIFREESPGVLGAAMEDPSNLLTIEFLESYLKVRIKPYIASEGDLNKGYSLYGKVSAKSFQETIEESVRKSLESRAKGEAAATDVPIIATVDNLLSYAMSLRSSDVHMEIFEDSILVRYRVDGILYEMFRLPKEIHPAVTARIKLLSGLKIDEHSKPQDGRFRYQVGTETIDVRVAIMPTFYGEKVEMRLLTAVSRPLSFAELGMFEDTVKLLEENVKKSYGMVLVCGPTGAGKTTTLYSVLASLNHPQVNIVTVEDPIEYDIKFINQTQINPVAGVTFATGLKSILRQDPNIIMVGEIRDEDTAGIAVQSALTGHLVLSSLHTNDAPTAIPRLMDMKVPQFLVAAVLNAVLSQRLVRKIHLDCIESYELDAQTEAAVRKQLSELGFDPNEYRLPKLLYKGKGCAADNESGYQGRVGIFEVLEITEEVRKLIVSPDFSLDALRALAKKEGMISMFEDGLRKVEQGITTIEEIFRVIRE